MKSKTCPNCKQISYSSSDIGSWICPNCNEELRFVRTNE